MNEVELIDRYLDALNRNPKALPPQELDAKKAAFVYAMWLLEHPHKAHPDLETRIWQKTLSAAEDRKNIGDINSPTHSRNGIEQHVTFVQSSENPQEEKNEMFPSTPLDTFARPRATPNYRLSSLVAAVLLLLVGSLLVLGIAQFRGGLPYAVMLQQPTLTPTPIPLEKITPENVDKLTQLYTIPRINAVNTAIAFSPDGKYMAFGNGMGVVDLWNVEKKQVEKKLNSPFEIAYRLVFSGNSHLLAVAGGQNDAIWDITTNENPLILSPHDPNTIATIQLAFSSDGQTLFDAVCSRVNSSSTGCTGDANYAWDVKSGKRTVKIDFASGLAGDIDISPVADLAVYDYADGRLLTRTFTSGLDQTVFQYEGAAIRGVTFNTDGTLLASVDSNHMVQFWDVAKGTSVGRIIQPDKPIDIGGIGFNPDDTLLVTHGTSNSDKNIQFWDVKNQKPLSHIEATELTIAPFFIYWWAFSPDGKLFASVSNDGKVRVWGVLAGS